jgi:hypothetical protein
MDSHQFPSNASPAPTVPTSDNEYTESPACYGSGTKALFAAHIFQQLIGATSILDVERWYVAHVTDAVLEYLAKAEDLERDVWLQDDYRLAWTTVLYASRNQPDPWGFAYWMKYGVVPARGIPGRDARYRMLLGIVPPAVQLKLKFPSPRPASISPPRRRRTPLRVHPPHAASAVLQKQGRAA